MASAFTGLDLADLTALKTAYLNGITALATMQSYTIAGRSVSRANLAELKQTLAEINAEIRRQNGTSRRVVYAGMNDSQMST